MRVRACPSWHQVGRDDGVVGQGAARDLVRVVEQAGLDALAGARVNLVAVSVDG